MKLNQDDERGNDSISNRVVLFIAGALEVQLNEQGKEMGVVRNAVIFYPLTVQILACYEDLQRESLIELVSKSEMGHHLTLSRSLKMASDPRGCEVRWFVEKFLAEFVAMDNKFSDQLRTLKGPVCGGNAVVGMVTLLWSNT